MPASPVVKRIALPSTPGVGVPLCSGVVGGGLSVLPGLPSGRLADERCAMYSWNGGGLVMERCNIRRLRELEVVSRPPVWL